MGDHMPRPRLKASEQELERWKYWADRLPPMQVGPQNYLIRRDTKQRIPSHFIGRCRGHMIAFMDPGPQKEWINYIRKSGIDPDFRIYTEHDVAQMIQTANDHKLAKSAYGEQDRELNAKLLARATMRTGCGRAIIQSPYFPIDMTGEKETYHCERCGRLDAILVVTKHPLIQKIIEWRRVNLMEPSHA